MRVVKYTEEKCDEWNRFLETSSNGLFLFNRSYMEYHSDRFNDCSLMIYSDENELLALLPLSITHNIIVSHGGLTFGGFIKNENMKQHKMEECVVALIDYMKENNIRKLIYKKIPYIYDDVPAEEDKYSLWHNGAQIFKTEPSSVIELSKIPKMSKGRKAQISRARREKVEIKESSNYEMFVDLLNEVLNEYHNVKAVHTAEELKILSSNFPKNIKLYIAEKNNQIMAGCLLFIYPNLIHTQYMVNSNYGRQIGALDLLIDCIIDKYKKEKAYLDFGISTENNGIILNSGLISQKESFGARTVVYETYEIGV